MYIYIHTYIKPTANISTPKLSCIKFMGNHNWIYPYCIHNSDPIARLTGHRVVMVNDGFFLYRKPVLMIRCSQTNASNKNHSEKVQYIQPGFPGGITILGVERLRDVDEPICSSRCLQLENRGMSTTSFVVFSSFWQFLVY